jgi:hypothetical protein
MKRPRDAHACSCGRAFPSREALIRHKAFEGHLPEHGADVIQLRLLPTPAEPVKNLFDLMVRADAR